MNILVEILTWLGLVALGMTVAAGFVVAALTWFLNHPVDDEVHPSARRC